MDQSPKSQPTILSFQASEEQVERIKQIMIAEGVFNRSKVVREIFELGLKHYTSK